MVRGSIVAPEYAKQVSDMVKDFQDKSCISENMAYLIVEQPKPDRFDILSEFHKRGNPGHQTVLTEKIPVC